MRKLIVYFLIVFLFDSCEEERDLTTTVKGYFREVRSDMPIVGTGFAMYYEPLFGQEEYIKFFGTFTDSTGYFEFTFNASKGTGYYLTPDALGYSCYPNCSIYLTSGEVNILNVNLRPRALFTLNLENEPPLSASDSIYFCLDGEYISDTSRKCWYCLGDCNENVFRNWTLQSNGIINLTWWVTENGITTPYSHDIELVSLDTVEYTIRY
jgi:hypothetical protein